MKQKRRILATILTLALAILVPQFHPATAKAETPTTFTIKYIESMGEWRVQPLSAWDDSQGSGILAYVDTYIKDGDTVVVVGGAGSPAFGELTLNAKVENLTLYEVTGGIEVKANAGIKDIFVLKGSVASLHGTYDNVYVYDNSICNILNDLKYLQISKESSMTMSITAVGTVGHCQIDDNGKVLKHMYNVKANTLRIVEGVDKTDPSNYSTTPTESPSAPGASGTATPSTSTPTENGAPASPKTGDSSCAIWIFAGALLCFAGARMTRKQYAK